MDIKSMAATLNPDLLTLEDKARHGLLPDILTIGQIVCLSTDNKEERGLLKNMIQTAIRDKKLSCTNPELAEWGTERHSIESRFEDDFIGGRKGVTVVYDGSSAPIHKDHYKQWLQSIKQWPIKNCLLVHWWADLEPQAEAVGSSDTQAKESQLHVFIWRVYQFLNANGKKSTAQKAWNEIQHRHKQHDTENIIQEVTTDVIIWCSGYGNEQQLKRSSFDKTLSNLKKNPPF